MAVKRSLEDNIAPELQTDYAKIQLSSAILALQEVLYRLETGDPCIRENNRIEKSMNEVSENIKNKFPLLSDKIKETLRQSTCFLDPREKNCFLKESLWGILKDAKKEEGEWILRVIKEYMSETIVEEQKWLNVEAITSLH
ncbi:MAG: hypothetical protein QXY90_05000 [Candidatus Anstonellales archaeon]